MNGRKPARVQDGAAGRSRRSPGRPREISEGERRRRLLSAAEQVFLEAGYSDATMDDIAGRARMSKRTLYAVFAAKEDLFAALVAARSDSFIAAIGTDNGAGSPREMLENFLRQGAQFVLSPRQVAMHRLVIAEAWRTPALARAFHREGPGRCKAAVRRWFAQQRGRGRFALDNAEEVAGMLFGMVIGELHMKLLMGAMHRPPSKAVIDRRIRRAVDIFLKGTGTR